MNHRFARHCLPLIFTALGVLSNLAPALELNSPDGQVVVSVDLKTVGASKGCPVYSVRFRGRPVLAESRLGLELRGGPLANEFPFSPWQFLFWYDKPAEVREAPALDYWKHLPTTWDETRVLQGEIGRRAGVARRKGIAWFVGAISPGDGKFQIPLTFLAPGKTFLAKQYSDKPNAQGLQIEERMVDDRAVLEAEIPANGGLAVRLIPTSE